MIHVFSSAGERVGVGPWVSLGIWPSLQDRSFYNSVTKRFRNNKIVAKTVLWDFRIFFFLLMKLLFDLIYINKERAAANLQSV